ncbi:uncharacterized protein [Asterias amurensis]|uniref:uncharacterized protein n=1 Tax=Asterias amurensis TaxID=7602 RepID=UPI003AB8C2AE
MDGRISMYVLLVCVWCSLDAGGLPMVATADPTVIAVILTPEADREEDGQVDMRCTATNLQPDSIVEWMTKNRMNVNPDVTLRWNDTTITSNSRFMYATTYPGSGMVVQYLTITDLQIEDYDEYICNVNHPITGGGSTIVATSSVILSAPSYPICSPSGPITVYTGRELQLRCLYYADNPAAIMETHQMNNSGSYTWTSLNTNDIIAEWTLNLTVGNAQNDVAFNCTVPQGTSDNVKRYGSCIIGPISVTMSTSTTITAVTMLATDTPPPASSSAAIAGAIGGGIAAILIIIIIILICRKRLCHQTTKDPVLNLSTKFTPDHPEHSPSFVDPYGVDTYDQSHSSHPVAPPPASKPAPSPTKPPSSDPAVYAQPNSNARGRYSENPDDVTSHNNPAFNSTGLDGVTELYAPMKPVAKVRPSKTPRKPEPYKPKSERQSNPPEPTNRDPMPQSPPNDHDESHPVPDNPTYAQVSRPKSNPDHIVYADLDLLSSDEAQDDEARRPQSSDAVMYASVKM